MPETYGDHERAALIVLALENREVPNPELTNDYRIKLDRTGRDRLNKAGLVKSRKENRRFVHKITPAGTDWCERELTGVEPPPRSGPLVRVVFEVLRRFAQQRGSRLADVVDAADLESMIREAYRELSEKPQDFVRLARLRDRLNGADKDEVDRTLLAMVRSGLVHLSPSSDRKALTEADHAAAIRIGKEDKHLVAIEES